MALPEPLPQIELRRPFGRLRPRKVYRLDPERIHPVIRIAHRMPGALRIDERLIFDHELVLMLAGEGELVLGGHPYRYGPRHLFLIPPFVPHRIAAADSTRGDHVAVHFDLAPGVPSFAHMPHRRLPYEVRFPEGVAFPPHVVLAAGDPIEAALLRLLRARGSAGPLARLEAVAHLVDALLQLLRRGRPAPARPEEPDARNRARLDRALAHVEARLAKPITAEELAAVAGMSASHFNRLFRNWAGRSPMEHLRLRRVERARELLAQVDLSIKEVAARTGFADAYHFSRVFRQIDGLSPSHFREALLAGRPRER